MKTEILHKKLERYVNGEAMPAETRQIQAWLSCTTSETELSATDKMKLEADILKEIQDETAYPLFYPKQEKPWWQKITAMF
ncbi:hypothetical protein LZZ85_23080 [Terrimonas sp. NA20]|uniref:Anti-sigma factor n=1 Tax=Terrimonas ginsenosidimutans TaxID=2908004 RepID=A0ABS9KY11_9BACT|nr:hypothetical protein [Terrimonas ginsenosidimutans]MCG2617198.1 hypothetical protein [Terrimonas ginsenosidimutans]